MFSIKITLLSARISQQRNLLHLEEKSSRRSRGLLEVVILVWCSLISPFVSCIKEQALSENTFVTVVFLKSIRSTSRLKFEELEKNILF